MNDSCLVLLLGFFCTADKPYIRLSPQLSPKLAHQGLSVEVNEGEDLELSVLVEAYPRLTEHRWDTPTSPNASTQENKFTRYNTRFARYGGGAVGGGCGYIQRIIQHCYSEFQSKVSQCMRLKSDFSFLLGLFVKMLHVTLDVVYSCDCELNCFN